MPIIVYYAAPKKERGKKMTRETVQRLACEAYGWFEIAQRADGTHYVRTKEEAPDWVADLVRAAHDGANILSDDWRYERIHQTLEYLADTDPSNWDACECADQAVDVYNADRLRWLGSHSRRAAYVDEAVDSMGWPGSIYDAIAYGQYEEAKEIYHQVLAYLENLTEEEEV